MRDLRWMRFEESHCGQLAHRMLQQLSFKLWRNGSRQTFASDTINLSHRNSGEFRYPRMRFEERHNRQLAHRNRKSPTRG